MEVKHNLQFQKDFLTGFFLRNNLNEFLDCFPHDETKKDNIFSIALIDLDKFKKFNDKFGHDCGDEILRHVTNNFRLVLKDDCYYFRLGGDEFLIVFPGKSPKETYKLMHVCARGMVLRPFFYKNKFYKLAFSCGISTCPLDATRATDLLKKADEAMYYSKKHGRNNITIASRIKFIERRKKIISIITVLMILLSFVYLFRQVFRPLFLSGKIKKILSMPASVDYDTVIFKNGLILKGNILDQSGDKVTIDLGLKKGLGVVIFDKKEIELIKYRAGNVANE